MADNTQLSTNTGTGDVLVTKEVSHGGDTAKLQAVSLMGVSGSEGSYTVADINGDASNGLDVDVTRVQGTVAVSNAGLTELAAAIDTEVQCDIVGALPAGANSIGQVTANAGTNLNTSALALEAGGNLAGAATSLAILDDWDESDRAKVNPIAGQAGVQGGSGTATALTQRVVLATDIALPAGTNGIGKLTANSGVDIGDVDVTSISAGTNAIGNVGLIGRTTGGMSIFRSIDLDETEEEVKATAGQIFSIAAFNRTAAPLYLKIYNATAANVTVGTTTPVLTFVVPANADSDGAGFLWDNPIGYAFGTAITAAATTGIADNDTGAPGANDCVVNIGYV